MKLSCNATTPQELRDEIVALLQHRAAQKEGQANATPSNPQKRTFLYAAGVLEDLADQLKGMEITNVWPAGLREGGE